MAIVELVGFSVGACRKPQANSFKGEVVGLGLEWVGHFVMQGSLCGV